MAVLKILAGGTDGQVLHLPREENVLGRHPDCEVVLEHGTVSRHHAKILYEDDCYFLEDLASRNGTFLNGEAIEGRTELHDGDQIKLSDVVVAFHRQIPETPSWIEVRKLAARNTPVRRTDDDQPVMLVADDELDDELSDSGQVESSSILHKMDVRDPGKFRFDVKPEMKLKAILEVTQALGRAVELDDVLPRILQSLFKIFPQAEQGFILLKDPVSQKLKVKATRTRGNSPVDAVAVSMTVVREAMSTGEAILSANVLDDSRFRSSTSLTQLHIRSIMCVPLTGQDGSSLGVIQVDTRDSNHEFTNEDLELIANVADQAARAVENAQLHEEVVRQRELERDLEFATQVQLGFLPHSRPQRPGYEFCDFYKAAMRIGGDYYDYIDLPDGRLAVTLGDVAGKGVPAALLMARLYSSARYQFLTTDSPSAAVSGLNDDIVGSGLGHRFITFLALVLDTQRHRITLVNAGHLPPIWRHASGETEFASRRVSSLPLGVIGHVKYESETLDFEVGDTFVAYTDGVTEAMNADREIFGRDRLKECVEHAEGDCTKLINEIMRQVREHSDENMASDDTCVVTARRTTDGTG